MTARGGVHHVELWIEDLARAEASWAPLLLGLGYVEASRWPHGVSWELPDGGVYVVVEAGPDRRPVRHDRTAPGLNHLALHAGSRADVDALVALATGHGWRLMFADRHPFAGGPEHYAACLENADGFEVELVATPGAQ